MMAIRERVSLYNRYLKPRVGTVQPFRTYYLIMEGTNTEPSYFRLLERELLRRRVRNSIAIVYLERTARDRGSNTPRQLYGFLQAFRKEKNDPGGVYFMVFDRDSYKNHPDPKQSYLDFLKIIKGSGIRILVTSPCFEIWVLLHRKNAYGELVLPNERNLFRNKRISPAHTYISRLVVSAFGFNPKAGIPEGFLKNLDHAMEESKNLTSDPAEMAEKLGENISDFIREICSDLRY